MPLLADSGLTRRNGTDTVPFVESVPSERDSYRHCFTYAGSERSIRRELLAMLAAAQRKVFVASFLIGDAELITALAAAADRLRGGVYVIAQLDENRLRRGLAELEGKTNDAEVRVLRKRFDEMTRHGIYVRGHANCHAKFAIVDDTVALVTSANLMTRALDETGENGVVITDQNEVTRLARLFARLWHTGCRWEAHPGEAYALRNRAPQAWSAAVPTPAIRAAPGVIWTDGKENFLLHTIRDVIGRANNDLLIATFLLQGLRKERSILLDSILDATARGVRVRLLLRPRRHSDEQLRDAELLAGNGVKIYGDPLTHAKALFADDHYGALFSANLDTKKGLTNGVEVGCRLDGTPALAEARRYIEHATEHAALTFTVNPAHSELATRLDAQWRTPWPFEERIAVIATATVRSAFQRAAENGPVLFTHDAQNSVTLHAGNRRWRLASQNDDRYQLTSVANRLDKDSTTIQLQNWLTTSEPISSRGICPAIIEWMSRPSGHVK